MVKTVVTVHVISRSTFLNELFTYDLLTSFCDTIRDPHTTFVSDTEDGTFPSKDYSWKCYYFLNHTLNDTFTKVFLIDTIKSSKVYLVYLCYISSIKKSVRIHYEVLNPIIIRNYQQ